MTTQPEALRLADALESCSLHVGDPEQAQAAAKLRRLHAIEGEWAQLSQDDGKAERQIARLHAVNQELLEALKTLIDMDVAYQRGPKVEEAVEHACAAIAKAEGQA